MLIISVGSVNVDVQMLLDRWPARGESMHARDFDLFGGGMAANVALFSRRAGVPSMLIGRVGSDVMADIATAELETAAVDLAHTRSVAGAATGVVFIGSHPDGDKTMIAADNANMHWDREGVAEAVSAIGSAPVESIVIADLQVPAFVVQEAAEAAHEHGLQVIIDPAPPDCMNHALYELADIVSANAKEAGRLAGFEIRSPEDATKAGEKIRTLGARAVIVRLSGGGCVVCSEGKHIHLRAVPVQAVDTTGAGDAFAAALGIGLLRGMPLEKAALLGMAAASIAVATFGAQPSYRDGADLEARFQELLKINGL